MKIYSSTPQKPNHDFVKRHNTTPLRLPTTQVCIGIGDVLKRATVREIYTGKS